MQANVLMGGGRGCATGRAAGALRLRVLCTLGTCGGSAPVIERVWTPSILSLPATHRESFSEEITRITRERTEVLALDC